MSDLPDNLSIYDSNWDSWLDMKRYGPASRWLRGLINDACKQLPTQPESIHDVGCGVGTNTEFLSEIFPRAEVRGSDFSSTAISVATAFCKAKKISFVHDTDNSALDRTADMVCCFEVLEHVEDWKGFLARLAGASERFVLLSFPTGRMRPFEVNVGHFRNFQPGQVEAAMRELSFEPLSLAYAGFPFYSPLYRDLCQLTNAGDAQFTKGTYGPLRRLLSAAIYFVFRYLSTSRRGGDQFVGLFVRSPLPSTPS